jgi:hypothetical protein
VCDLYWRKTTYLSIRVARNPAKLTKSHQAMLRRHAQTGLGKRHTWLLTALFVALVGTGIWIDLRNWRQDPAQRSMGHLVT